MSHHIRKITNTAPSESPAIADASSPPNHTTVDAQNSTTPATNSFTACPSFDDEPWRTRAAALRPKALDYWTTRVIDLDNPPAPLPSDHAYRKLLLEFLASVPKECWLDEENEED